MHMQFITDDAFRIQFESDIFINLNQYFTIRICLSMLRLYLPSSL